MKKLIISVVVVVAFAIYALAYHNNHSRLTATSDIVAASTATTASGSSSTATYKNGTYTGSAVDATYGTVQVQVTTSGGKITKVTFLSQPGGRGESVQINANATPILTQEAIAAQSANVQTVSGATFTSNAFIQSLQSALTKAG